MRAPETTILASKSLSVGYGARAILPPLDLSILRGQIWSLVGRNGGGKSTLLRTLLGLLPAVGGEVVRAPGARLAYVAQRSDEDLEVPGRVIDVVRLGVDRALSFLDLGAVRRARATIEAALHETDTTSLSHRAYAELSEGQKQRVRIARALVSAPDLIVLDEPTSAMDPINERAIFELLARVVQTRNVALLMASHQMSVVLDHATHAIFVDADDGTLATGPAPEVLAHAAFRRRYGIAASQLATQEGEAP